MSGEALIHLQGKQNGWEGEWSCSTCAKARSGSFRGVRAPWPESVSRHVFLSPQVLIRGEAGHACPSHQQAM